MAAKTDLGGMILLEPHNRIVAEVARDKIARAIEEKKHDVLDVHLCDFDDVRYHLSSAKESKSVLKVSMLMPCYEEIKGLGSRAALETEFGDMLVEPEAGFNITMAVDCDNMGKPADEIVKKISMLKSTALGGIFDMYFTALLKGTDVPQPFRFKLRTDTEVFFVPKNDRVIVIFSLDFNERVDRAIARVFMQEFVESRRHLGAAPPCSFSVNPPLELQQQWNITEPVGGNNIGFVSFAILKGHVDNKMDSTRKDNCVQVMYSFRNYIQYHIKCSKAYFHMQMRKRVISLLKVLNRAKADEDEVVKKTISGKTFTRK